MESIGRGVFRFNEAGGFLPRKRDSIRDLWKGNMECFNEAGGFLPRKPASAGLPISSPGKTCFNEAGGFLPRKPEIDEVIRLAISGLLQ